MSQPIPYLDSSGIKIDKLKEQMDRRLQKIRRMIDEGFKKRKKKRKSRVIDDFPGMEEGVQTDFQIQYLITPRQQIAQKSGRQYSTVQTQKNDDVTGANTSRSRNRKLTLTSLGTQINIQGHSESRKSPAHSIKQQGNRKCNQRYKTTEANNQQSQQEYDIPIDQQNLEFQDSLDQQRYIQQTDKSPRIKQRQSPFKERIAKISQLSSIRSHKVLVQAISSKQRIQKENDQSKQAISPRSKNSPSKNLVNIKSSILKSNKKQKKLEEGRYQRPFKTEMQEEQFIKLDYENDCLGDDFNNSLINQLAYKEVRSTINLPSLQMRNPRLYQPQASTQRRKIVRDVVDRLSPQKGDKKQKKTQKQTQQKVVVTNKTKEKMQNLVKVIGEKARRATNDGTVRSNLLKRIEEKNKKR